MNLYGFVRAILRAWWVVAISALVGALVGLGLVTTQGESYAVTNQVFVKVLSAGSASDLSAGAVFTNQQMALYPLVVTSRDTLQRVAGTVDLDVTAEELAQWVSAEVPADTPVVTITVTAAQAQAAEQVSQALGEVVVEEIEQLELRPGSPESPVEAEILRPAVSGAVDVSIPLSEALIGGAIVGTGLGLTLVVLLYVRSQMQAAWDRTRSSVR